MLYVGALSEYNLFIIYTFLHFNKFKISRLTDTQEHNISLCL